MIKSNTIHDSEVVTGSNWLLVNTIRIYARLKTFCDMNSVNFVKMCLKVTVLTGGAWEPGSRFLRFVEVWQFPSSINQQFFIFYLNGKVREATEIVSLLCL